MRMFGFSKLLGGFAAGTSELSGDVSSKVWFVQFMDMPENARQSSFFYDMCRCYFI